MESYTLEEKVLRKVMRNIPMGLIVSKEGFRRKIYYVNDTACEIMGYTREEYIQKDAGRMDGSDGCRSAGGHPRAQ